MMSKRSTTTAAMVAAALMLLLGLLAAVANPVSARAIETTELINFSTGDPATDPGTEGIDVDADGNVYVSANTAAGGDWIELANTTNEDIDVGGWFLSDDGDTLDKYQIPADTTFHVLR